MIRSCISSTIYKSAAQPWNLVTMDYALQILIPILIGLFAGHWLDRKTGYDPWFTLAGFLVGTVLGIGILYKRVTYGPSYDPDNNEKDKRQ